MDDNPTFHGRVKFAKVIVGAYSGKDHSCAFPVQKATDRDKTTHHGIGEEPVLAGC